MRIYCEDADTVTIEIPDRGSVAMVAMRAEAARRVARALDLHAEQAEIIRDHPARTAIGPLSTEISA